MNSWEQNAYQYSQGEIVDTQAALIIPGLYSRSSFNMMSILAQIYARPNPKVELGFVDDSCSIVLCDLGQPDHPIVYATRAFYDMTGYADHEVLGRNCRFLQAPGGKVKAGSKRRHVDDKTVRRMRKSLEKRTEVQTEVVNFKKDGQKFINILTMIPVTYDGLDYCVGFQCEKE